MQDDGNFVVYQGTVGGPVIWASGVIPGVANGPYSAVMQDDSNFVIYQGTGGHAIWASTTVQDISPDPTNVDQATFNDLGGNSTSGRVLGVAGNQGLLYAFTQN